MDNSKDGQDLEQFPRERPIRYAARGILLQSGKMLILQRSDTSSSPRQWEVPGGTVSTEDISPKATCRREIKNETGIIVNVEEPVGVFSCSDPRSPEIDGMFLTFIYVVSLAFPGLGPDAITRRVNLSSEHSNHAWVEPSYSVFAKYRFHPDTVEGIDCYIRRVLQQPIDLMRKGANLQRIETNKRVELWLEKQDLSKEAAESLLACLAMPFDE